MINFITATDFRQCQRLFHGRGHFYPNLNHVNVDWLPPVAVITLYQACDEQWLNEQASALQALIMDCSSVQVQRRYLPKAPTEVLLGEKIEHCQVTESNNKFHIELGKAQNTGLFLDMRNGRQWLQTQTYGKTVLNLFAYTCAFSVAALAGGAEKVVNVDISKSSLSKGRDNHHLNKQDLSKVKFEGVDIFKSYGRLKKHGPYDILVCDPPSFQKGSVNIERDYSKIIKRIPQLMKPNSQLLLCLNSPDLSEQFLLDQVAEHCPDCQFEYKLDNPDVFKEAHEGKGLKVMLFTYLPSESLS